MPLSRAHLPKFIGQRFFEKRALLFERSQHKIIVQLPFWRTTMQHLQFTYHINNNQRVESDNGRQRTLYNGKVKTSNVLEVRTARLDSQIGGSDNRLPPRSGHHTPILVHFPLSNKHFSARRAYLMKKIPT